MRESSSGAAPAVSIVLPTFNRVDVIGRALDSVRQQTFGDFELLVIDDGSTDGTAELVAGLGDPRIRVVRQANAGVYVARNLGLREACGRWITFLDSDDAWAPQFLELVKAVPSDRWVAAGFRGALRALDVGERLLNGKLTPTALALRLLRGARPSEM